MDEIFSSLGLTAGHEVQGTGALPSRYAVTDLAAASFAAVGAALADLMIGTGLTRHAPRITVDRRLASLWFGSSIRPLGWEMPPVWDAIAGDYPTSDGWIRLHTNLPHHRQAALKVLGCAEDRETVAAAVRRWQADALESAVVAQGGVAAAMRSAADWAAHPQGRAVAADPLIRRGAPRAVAWRERPADRTRPLAGLRVLDLTRVLAGPVATRALAGFGAEVLRVDPPWWEEANVVPDITLGKRCCHLDLRQPADRAVLEALLPQADLLIHGYRPDALAGLGYDEAARRALAPNLIEVSLDAYGWAGPWAARRGFDSLVQMSCGIAEAGMGWAGREVPTPMPVQALDHATGYLMASAALRALADAAAGRPVANMRLSLARTATLLMGHLQPDGRPAIGRAETQDYSEEPEATPWGPAARLRPALTVEGTPMRWERPATELGSSPPAWG